MRGAIQLDEAPQLSSVSDFRDLLEPTPAHTDALRSRIDPARVPNHVAIIMDGNGRWAEQHGEPRIMGHASGVRSVREALTGATEIGVRWITLYAFSTENWNRPRPEVEALMDLLVKTVVNEIDELHDNGTTVIFSTHVMSQAQQICDHIVMIHLDPRRGIDPFHTDGLPGATVFHGWRK